MNRAKIGERSHLGEGLTEGLATAQGTAIPQIACVGLARPPRSSSMGCGIPMYPLHRGTHLDDQVLRGEVLYVRSNRHRRSYCRRNRCRGSLGCKCWGWNRSVGGAWRWCLDSRGRRCHCCRRSGGTSLAAPNKHTKAMITPSRVLISLPPL